MTNTQLTAGSITRLRSKSLAADVKPLLQVLSISPTGAAGSERFKLQISDGQAFMSAMLASQLNEIVKKGELRQNAIIRVEESIVNDFAGQVVVILLRIEIVEYPQGKIGNPVDTADMRGGQAQPHQPTTNSNRVFAPAAVPTRQAPVIQNEAPAPSPYMQQYPQTSAYQAPAGASVQAYQQQQPMQNYSAPAPVAQSASRAPVAPLQSMVSGLNRSTVRTIPIKMLNPYQNKWVIRARVTAKSDVRTWDKGPNNQGKLFSVDLVDNDGGEIRATFFREAVDMFFETMRVGGVYTFSEGRVKIANRQFSGIKNEYELNFGKEAQIQAVADEGDIARVHIQPVAINDLNTVEPKMTVDVIGIATEIGEVSAFTSKAGKDLRKLEFQLVDRSNASIKVSVWGQKADDVANELRGCGPDPVVAVKSAQVGDFGGRSLSSISSTSILINPYELPIAGQLRSWYDEGGGRSGVSQLTAGREGAGEGRQPASVRDRLTIDAIKTQGLGKNGQDFCDVKAYLWVVPKDNLWYAACPTEKCNKKMTKDPSDDRWSCEKCNLKFDEPHYRFIARVGIADPTGSAYCTAFNEIGNTLFGGVSAKDLEQLKQHDPAQFDAIIRKSNFQEGIFRLKIKEELYQDQPQVKNTVMNFRPIDYVAENKELLKSIEQYESMK